MKGGEFRVALSSPQVPRVLSVTRLDSQLSIYRTLDEALIAVPGTGEPATGVDAH